MSLKALDNFYFGTARPASGGVTPTGEISITSNGNYDVTEYATANVNTPSSDMIQATNMTGLSVSTGEKVFLKKDAFAQSETRALNSSSNNVFYLTNADGTLVWYGETIYNIASKSTSSARVDLSYMEIRDGNFPRYEENGNIRLGARLWIDWTDKFYAQDDYFVDNFSNTTSITLKNTNNTWTVSEVNSSLEAKFYSFCVIDNKFYVSSLNGTFKKVGTINANESTIILEDRTDNLPIVVHSTIDNNLVILSDSYQIGNSTSVSLGGYFNGISFAKNDNGVLTAYTTKNFELQNLCRYSHLYIVFNRYTGVLCLSSPDKAGAWGMFKYNSTTQDFDTIPLILSTYNPKTYQMLSVSNDMTKMTLGSQLYILTPATSGYVAIPIDVFMGWDVLTGYATSAAVHGEVFNASTILGK